MTKRKMKDSGVAWIGQVPEGWKICRFKDEVVLYTGNSIPDNLKCEFEDRDSARPYVSSKDIGLDYNTVNYENGMYVKLSDTRFEIAPKNSILMCVEGGSAGRKKAFLEQEVSFVNKLCCFYSDRQDNRYLYYYLMSPNYEECFRQQLTGMIGGVSTKDLKNIKLLLPPLRAQRAIAAFLDGECGKIDTLRGKVEKQIAALEEYRKSAITEAVTKGIKRGRKMKVADVAWIATAPQEWERTRLKLLCDRDITYGIVKLGDPDEDGVKVLRCSDVLAGRIAEGEIRTVTKSLSQEYSRTILRGGEVVVNVRGTLGGCAVVPEKMRGYNIAREVAMVAVKRNAADARFIMYQLLSSSFDSYIKMQLSGAVYVGLNIEMLGKYSFFCPDLSEQREIAAYLDKKCATIDSMVAKCREELDRLTEYKKSLIYEYVTGKKEVA